jgi:tetratricopeptide (TPR) repeat protein
MSVFWVHASNSARLEQAFSDIAQRVGLYSRLSAAIDTVLAVCTWLSNEANGRWLMIVDNVDDEIAIESQRDGQSMPLASLLPQSDHGAVLITSRNADVARGLVGRQQDIIQVGAMNDSEAVELLRNKLGEELSEGATQLVTALDCIPLAIAQAAAYINRLGQRMPIPKYLDQLKGIEGQVELLRKAAPDMRRDGKALNSVLTTWQISFEHIRQQRPSAADLLSFMSFFNPQSIPDFMLRHYTDNKNKEQDNLVERQTNRENDNFEEDVAFLRAFSLVDTKQREDEFEMHRLVQLATTVWLKSANREGIWRRAFIQAMAQEFPTGEYANWPRCHTLFPHVLHMVEQKEPSSRETNAWALLLNNTGWYALRQGLFGQAESMVLEAVRIRKKILGSDEPSTLLSLNLLASVLADLGKYSEAESMHRQNLATREKVLGLDHLDTLMTMNNLALVLGRQGKYSEAESMHRQTLATRKKVLGLNHPDTLQSMNNLALVLGRQGKYSEAELMHRQTLATCEKVLGLNHPDTLQSINNLAEVLYYQDKYVEAESIYRQTLATCEKVLGLSHPETLATINNLALALSRQGKYSEAELMHRQTLATCEKALGLDHPDTLTIVYCLAYLLASRHRYDESTTLYERACAGYLTTLGKDHPTTRVCHQHYAQMLVSQQSGNRSGLRRTFVKLSLRYSKGNAS